MANIVKRGQYNKKLNLDAALPSVELQHVWYEIKKRQGWASIALVPVDDEIQTLDIAHSLGLMAIRELHDVVWVVNASSARNNIKPSDVSAPGDDRYPYNYKDLSDLGINKEKQLFTAEQILNRFAQQKDEEEDEGAAMSLIFSVDSILNNTHVIPLCRSVDGVILCIELGTTTIKSVRRTVEIIGNDSILGSIVLKRKSR